MGAEVGRGVSRLRLFLGAVGVATSVYGVWGLLTERYIRMPSAVGEWLLGGLILHDAVLAPVVFVLCAIAYRVTSAKVRGRLAFLLLVGGSVSLVALPAILRKGHNANPTVLPMDYARNLAGLLAVLVGCVLLVAGVGALRGRHKVAAIPRPVDDPVAEDTAEDDHTDGAPVADNRADDDDATGDPADDDPITDDSPDPDPEFLRNSEQHPESDREEREDP